MKLIRLGPDAIFYRCLTPKWAFVPESGAGAAAEGGRFNRPGVEALYLARDPETAIAEYQQGASIAPPAVLAAFHVSASHIVDFANGFASAAWPPDWAAWDCAWKQIARIERKVPPSWKLADEVIGAGHRGLLYPSRRHASGTNLVLYPQNFTANDRCRVHDPDGRLPHNQSSWL